MKKSDIYKLALAATIKEIKIAGGYTPDTIYEIVSQLCKDISMELTVEQLKEKDGGTVSDIVW